MALDFAADNFEGTVFCFELEGALYTSTGQDQAKTLPIAKKKATEAGKNVKIAVLILLMLTLAWVMP